jgi:diphosphomevalonate decarboxylase
MSEAVAMAHPNVALSKYWGKTGGGKQYPAVPSLSVTLSGLTTRTRVRFDEQLSHDRLWLDGKPADAEARDRVEGVLTLVREASGETRKADVTSHNDFPTASGLASSASGFAALALAAVGAAGLEWGKDRLSDLARRGSASAARSVFGGYVELLAGPPAESEGGKLAARPAADADHLPLVVIVCVVTEGPKVIGSREGMRTSMQRSPYASAWVEEAPRLHARLRSALLDKDFAQVGELAEASALAMHACAIAGGVTYWTGATLELLAIVRRLRDERVAVYATMDAGPHVKVLVQPQDVATVREALQACASVKRLIEATPGEGARYTHDERAL